jgi:hypothetical protein
LAGGPGRLLLGADAVEYVKQALHWFLHTFFSVFASFQARVLERFYERKNSCNSGQPA